MACGHQIRHYDAETGEFLKVWAALTLTLTLTLIEFLKVWAALPGMKAMHLEWVHR